MSKTDNNKDYVISLNGSEGAILTYTSLNNTVLPSMTVNDIDLLPDSEHSQAILKRLSISEKGLHFATPVIKMYFSPYLMYKIQGFHDTNGDGKPDCFVQGTLANWDGEILSYYNYLFDYGKSQDIFVRAFDVYNNDTAAKSLQITKFSLSTSNRDFDMTQYKELTNSQFAANTAALWRKGLNATVEADFKDD